MKWLLLFLFLPFFSLAQGVKLNRYDVFLKKQRLEMEPVILLNSPDAKLSIAYSSLASDLFIQMKGSGWGATTVDEGDDLIFRFTNDSTVVAKSVSLQTFQPGIGGSSYQHQYRIPYAAVQAFTKFELASLRKYSFKEFTDRQIPREAAAKLQRPAALFLMEWAKAAAIKNLKKIDVKDIYNHTGDSVFFCSKIYNVRRSASELSTVLEMQTDFSQPIVRVVIREKEYGSVGDARAWLNKDACVSGVLTLENNVPTVTVLKKEQLKTAGAETDRNNLTPPTPTGTEKKKRTQTPN